MLSEQILSELLITLFHLLRARRREHHCVIVSSPHAHSSRDKSMYRSTTLQIIPERQIAVTINQVAAIFDQVQVHYVSRFPSRSAASTQPCVWLQSVVLDLRPFRVCDPLLDIS